MCGRNVLLSRSEACIGCADLVAQRSDYVLTLKDNLIKLHLPTQLGHNSIVSFIPQNNHAKKKGIYLSPPS